MTPHEPTAEWDVFLSYSRADAPRAALLVQALRDHGLRVFVDDSAVDDFASITDTITRALAQSKTLLAVYSADYPRRRACQWELTYAYVAGQREGDPRRRILVANPEPGTAHIHPLELRDARHWSWSSAPEDVDRLAGQVAAHAESLTAAMGGFASTPFVPWLPAPAHTGSPRFVGRIEEQWRIHSALHGHRVPLVSQSGTGRTAQLRGMPGIGKSLLAQEYAVRFSSTFPSGIFWFDLHIPKGGAPSLDGDTSHALHAVHAEQAMRAYAEQVATVVAALGLDVSADTLPHMLSRLAIALGERGTPCLWVVDGVPDGLTDDQLHLLRGPHLFASTLITTRSLRYGAFAEAIDVPPLPDADGYRLLTSRRAPHDEQDSAAALALIHDVGGHPQALELLADLGAISGFTQVRIRLHSPGTDLLAAYRPEAGSAEHPERRLLTAPLLDHPLTGRDPADDVLRLLALACPAPLSESVIASVLSALAPYGPWAGTLVTDAVEALLGRGALHPDPENDRAWTIHPLLARAVRRHDPDTARQEDLRRMLLHTFGTPAPHTPSPRVPAALGTPAPGHEPRAASPGPAERAAAFELQVELVSRVGVHPLPPDQGSLREALTSLHSLFATTRAALHRVAREGPLPLTVPRIASALLNQHLRPFLTTWHPALLEHEATRPEEVSAVEHERTWKRAADMRADLAALQAPLSALAQELAALSGIDLTPDTQVPPATQAGR